MEDPSPSIHELSPQLKQIDRFAIMQAAVQFKHIHIIGHQPQEGVGIPIEAYGEILLLSAIGPVVARLTREKSAGIGIIAVKIEIATEVAVHLGAGIFTLK
jgi:hypothetical protein